MKDLEKYTENFDKIYNSFTKETVGNNRVKLMPPLSSKPQIQKIAYDKKEDVFEIVFAFDEASVKKVSNNVVFIENQKGELLAVQISNFSNLKIESIKISIKSSIDNKIQKLSLEIKQKQRIAENVIDKRKLNFIKNIIQSDYKDLSKDNINLVRCMV